LNPLGWSAQRDGAVNGLEKIGAGSARLALVTHWFHDGSSNYPIGPWATDGSYRAYPAFHPEVKHQQLYPFGSAAFLSEHTMDICLRSIPAVDIH
jgi:hypothetical protein